VKSFENRYLERLPLSLDLVRAVGMLREFKGRQELHKRQIPQALDTLRQAAIIQSTESSNRIEGVVAPLKRIQALIAEKTTPRDRSEQEIAGYRDVLNTIHANHADIPFKPSIVLQFHRDLYQYAGGGGRWKGTDNDVVERHADGKTVLRFKPVPAIATPDHMEQLHERFDYAWNEGKAEPLLLIAAYVLDFLCIHPFSDGNGRMARLLTLLLLYHAEHEVGRYISLERIVERSKESYYDTLYQSSQGWHEGRHDL
jgi:Fic family protein